MVEDLKPGTVMTTPETSIDGEYTAYRAIHPFAIISLVFGIISILCVLDINFWPITALSVACGWFALKRINAYRDIYTGDKSAKLGIALGLVFFLMSASYATTQYTINRIRASQFGENYAKVLSDEPLESILWWELAPMGRKNTTPKEYYDSMVKQAPSAEMIAPKVDPIRAVKARLASAPNHVLTYKGINAIAAEQLDVIASLSFEISGPTSEAYPDAKELAIVVIRGNDASGEFGWTVESMKFPLDPSKGPTLPPLTIPTKAAESHQPHGPSEKADHEH